MKARPEVISGGFRFAGRGIREDSREPQADHKQRIVAHWSPLSLLPRFRPGTEVSTHDQQPPYPGTGNHPYSAVTSYSMKPSNPYWAACCWITAPGHRSRHHRRVRLLPGQPPLIFNAIASWPSKLTSDLVTLVSSWKAGKSSKTRRLCLPGRAGQDTPSAANIKAYL